MVREREGMLVVGPANDRRAFKHLDDVYNSGRVRQLVCLVCAQSKTVMGLLWKKSIVPGDDAILSEIGYRTGRDLLQCYKEHPENFDRNLGFNTFVERYADGYQEGRGPFAHATELQDDNWEWHRILKLPPDMGGLSVPLICCPAAFSY